MIAGARYLIHFPDGSSRVVTLFKTDAPEEGETITLPDDGSRWIIEAPTMMKDSLPEDVHFRISVRPAE